MTPYSRRQLSREERITNYRISRGRRVAENVFGILMSRFRVLLDTMKQRPRVVRGIVFTCVVLQNMLRIHPGRADRASREVQHQRELQKDFNTPGAEETGIYQSFSGLPNYSKNFYLSWCCSNFQRNSNPFPTISNQITSSLNLFKTVKSEKVESKGQNTFPKCQCFIKSKCFDFCQIFFFFFWGGGGEGGDFYWLCRATSFAAGCC